MLLFVRDFVRQCRLFMLSWVANYLRKKYKNIAFLHHADYFIHNPMILGQL